MSVSLTLHRQMLGIAAAFGHNHSAVLSWLKLSCQQQGCRLEIHPYVWTLRKENKVIRFAPRQYADIPHAASRFDVYFESLIAEVKGQEQLLDFSRVHASTYRKPGLTFEFDCCPEEVDVLDSYLEAFKPSCDEVAFDIGAHCGVFTYILSKLAGHVVAFEKDPAAHTLLQRNIERHALQNITLVKDSPSLQDAFSQWGIPSYCKIDLNGEETDLLASARSILSECDTHLAIRTTHDAQGVCTQSKVEEILRACRFETKSDEVLGTTCARPT